LKQNEVKRDQTYEYWGWGSTTIFFCFRKSYTIDPLCYNALFKANGWRVEANLNSLTNTWRKDISFYPYREKISLTFIYIKYQEVNNFNIRRYFRLIQTYQPFLYYSLPVGNVQRPNRTDWNECSINVANMYIYPITFISSCVFCNIWHYNDLNAFILKFWHSSYVLLSSVIVWNWYSFIYIVSFRLRIYFIKKTVVLDKDYCFLYKQLVFLFFWYS
jgi:hypothetical protein